MNRKRRLKKHFSKTQTPDIAGNGLGRETKKTNRLAIINKFLLFSIIVVGISYVASINDLSIKGFMLEELRVSKNKLDNENVAIELKIMDLESYENINKRASDLKMVKVDKIDYITVFDETVAKK